MKTITVVGLALSAALLCSNANAAGGRQVWSNMKAHAGMMKSGTTGLARDTVQAGAIAAKDTVNAAGKIVTTTVNTAGKIVTSTVNAAGQIVNTTIGLGVQATKAIGHDAMVLGRATVHAADKVLDATAQTLEAARVEGHLATAAAAGTTAKGFEKLGGFARKLQAHEIKAAQ